ncbi:hypothetical protein DY000_02013317 [Brassica cretica]|uniref:E3 ubiquitin-protein ligase RNF123/RKP TPR repeat domain-containing protein n=1 Tax=Brassica cretica TaxID=69181 RepID=A0ABQ7D8J8_BRACR|nr:hypothetical protein DY000_02013317 [Brassica cretica]
MANSFTFLADLKAGRCSNNEEAIQHVSWTIAEFSFSVMEFQQRKCCVILELSSNLPRVLEVCTSAIPQAFLDGTDTNPSRLTEEGTNVPKVALPEVVVPGRDDKDGLCFQCRTAVASPTKDHRPEQQLNLHKQCSYPSQLELSAISLATWEGSELAKAFFDHRDNAELLGPCFVLFLSGGITIQVHYILVQVLYSLSFCWVFEPLKLFIIISSLPPRFRESSRDSVSLKVKAFTLLVTLWVNTALSLRRSVSCCLFSRSDHQLSVPPVLLLHGCDFVSSGSSTQVSQVGQVVGDLRLSSNLAVILY